MKKLTILSLILLCAAVLLTACTETIHDPTVNTAPMGNTDPTNAPTSPTVPTVLPTDPTDPPADPPTDPPTEPTDPTIPLPTAAGNSLDYQPGLIVLENQESDDYYYIRKYRITYYRIYSDFFDLLSEDELNDSYSWLVQNSEQTNYGELQTEMLLVSLVKRYNISREDFDKAVDSYIARRIKSGTDMTLEEYEVPNADVIYTFDNELINRYYRYE